MRFKALAIVLILAAGVADAAPGKFTAPVTDAGLRGVSAAAPGAAASPATTTPPTPGPLESIAPDLAPASGAALDVVGGQCHQACAHAYYFCLASEITLECAPDWTSCLSDCRQAPRPLPLSAE